MTWYQQACPSALVFVGSAPDANTHTPFDEHSNAERKRSSKSRESLKKACYSSCGKKEMTKN
jgi:hypothetical protein